MKRRDFNKLMGAATVSGLASDSVFANQQWSLSADIAECCSCSIPCPCNFGKPTSMSCYGNRLIEIYEGHFNDVNIAGIKFVVTFEMGKWAKIFIDDQLDKLRFQALEGLLPLAFGYFNNTAILVERVPLKVVRDVNFVKFSVPSSAVEMKALEGLDGSLISIDGLPSKAFFDYIQYQSIKHIHHDDNRDWSYSGTNGFISRMHSQHSS